ncbi:hypothetical protein L5515_019623 [Caenorhabditis briggsae]|uniref:Sdz-33 F-box domain-containing protein n=1 Tax=Caenorhabditis briggsae TaxID=6238 RepID=A0AAE9FIZ2_CAEBR|nr:hypothetical protein L5515_019623 [Caenorhabditis briggsae]
MNRRPRFPILRVDNVVFREIISNIAPMDLASLAQPSKHCQQNIRSNKSIFSALNIAILFHEDEPVQLELSFKESSYEDDEIEDSDNEDNNTQDRIRYYLYANTESGEMIPMSTEDVIKYFTFFCDLLIRDNSILKLSIYLWTGDLVKIFNWISTRQESVKKCDIYLNHIKDSDPDYFLGNVRVSHYLGMNVLPSLEYRAQCYQQLETIVCQNAFWWRLEHCLMFDCKDMNLEDTHLTNDNIVWLLEGWMDGSGLKRLENMSLDGNNLDRNVITNKVDHVLLDRKSILAFSELVFTENVIGGALIERHDGVKAVIPFPELDHSPLYQFELNVVVKQIEKD